MSYRVEGGHKIRAWHESVKRQAASPTTIIIGFRRGGKTTNVVVWTAEALEFGLGHNLPERPAFRQGASVIRQNFTSWLADAMKGTQAQAFGLSREAAVSVALKMRDVLRESYMTFHSERGLSERQRERKAGSLYADKELIGSEGPKLIQHIHVWVDGEKVG